MATLLKILPITYFRYLSVTSDILTKILWAMKAKFNQFSLRKVKNDNKYHLFPSHLPITVTTCNASESVPLCQLSFPFLKDFDQNLKSLWSGYIHLTTPWPFWCQHAILFLHEFWSLKFSGPDDSPCISVFQIIHSWCYKGPYTLSSHTASDYTVPPGLGHGWTSMPQSARAEFV